MIIGSLLVGLIGLGGTLYAGDQQRKLSEKALEQEQQMAFASQKTLLSIVELAGLAAAAFSIAYIVGKNSK